MQDLVVFVQHHDCAGGQTLERAIRYVYSVLAMKIPAAKSGQGHHVVESLGTAKTRHREREVGGNDQHDRVVHAGGLLIEYPRGLLAGGRIQAGDDIQHLAFSGVIVERYIAKILAGQAEVRNALTLPGQIARHGYRISLQCYGCHLHLLLYERTVEFGLFPNLVFSTYRKPVGEGIIAGKAKRYSIALAGDASSTPRFHG